MSVTRKAMLLAEPAIFRMLDPLLRSRKARLQRSVLAQKYARGYGAEIGAFSQPCLVPIGARTIYIDRVPASYWRAQPEYVQLKLVEPDVIDDGLELSSIASNSLDYLIAAHVLEHADDAFKALENWIRVVRPGGHLILAVPDMRHTDDRKRQVTAPSHFVRDYKEGAHVSAEDHYRDVATNFCGMTDLNEIEALISEAPPAIHFHTFTLESFLAMLTSAKGLISGSFDIVEAQLNCNEDLVVLEVK